MTREEAIDVLKNNYPSSCYEDLCKAVDMAIKALEQPFAQSENLQPTCNQLATDCISRQAAIDALCKRCDLVSDEPCTEECNDIKILKLLPSAQPEHGKNSPLEQHKMDKLGVKTEETCTDTISRRAAVDVVHDAIFDFFDICDDDEESPLTYWDEKFLELNKAITTSIKNLPSAQPEPSEITDEKAILHLQSTGWMQNHDREMYEMGLKEQLADDSDSYDSLMPSAQPEVIRCGECLMHGACRFEIGLGENGFCSQGKRGNEDE